MRCVLWGILCAASPALAFTESTTSGGAPLHWARTRVTVGLDAASGGELPPAEVARALEGACQAWSSLPEARVTLEAGDAHPDVVVRFDDRSWNMGVELLAYTVVEAHVQSGEIVAATIDVDELNHPFSVDGSPSTFDLQAVLTHELGHALGLGHSKDEQATMFASTAPGDDHQRVPDDDDRAGIAALYDTTSEAPSGGTPSGGTSSGDTSSGGTSSGGTSSGGTSGGAPSGGAGVAGPAGCSITSAGARGAGGVDAALFALFALMLFRGAVKIGGARVIRMTKLGALDAQAREPAGAERLARSLQKGSSMDPKHTELVHRIAGALARHLPPHVDRDELISLGYMGLVEARKRYQAKRGVPFAAFAAGRIRGAMLDGLRRLDPVSRDERARLRRSGGPASVSLVPFELIGERAANDTPVDEQLQDREERQQLWRALAHLTDRERQVVRRYFFDGAPLKQVGAELGVTESRACQLVSAVVARLREIMGDQVLAEAA